MSQTHIGDIWKWNLNILGIIDMKKEDKDKKEEFICCPMMFSVYEKMKKKSSNVKINIYPSFGDG